MPWTVVWKVEVNGQDMTAAMKPFLTDITVTDKAGESSDTCSLTFDDTDAQIRLPAEGSSVRVSLQGVQVFQGIVDKVRSSGARGGGRTLSVQAKGMDSRGKVKEPVQLHQDDGSVGDFLKKLGGVAGYSVKVDGALGAIVRTYLAADGESFLHVGQRLARELGGTFKIRGTEAVLAKRGEDAGLPAIAGRVGEGGNVVSWNIAPFNGRPAFTKAKVQWFDRETAAFKEKEVGIDLGRALPEAVNLIRSKAADEGQAKDITDARKREAEREGGEGSVELDLEPEAQAEGKFTLTGARPGIDGTYRIESVSHKATRSGGSTTSLTLKQPQGNAGKDTRKKDASAAASSTSGAATSSAEAASSGQLEFIGATPGDGPE